MHSLLETYLWEVAAQLSSLPAERRIEELTEMRTHLLATVEAHQKGGPTEQEAVEAARRQFGPSSEAARGLIRAWQRSRESRLATVKGAFFGAGALWSSLVLCSVLGNYLVGHPAMLPAIRPYFEPLYYGLLLILSALLGSLSGGRMTLRGILWGAGLGFAGPIVVDEALISWKDWDVLEPWNVSNMLYWSQVMLLQTACLTGAVWAASRRRQGAEKKGKHAQLA